MSRDAIEFQSNVINYQAIWFEFRGCFADELILNSERRHAGLFHESHVADTNVRKDDENGSGIASSRDHDDD